jgi:hypothetical protein
VVSKRRHEVVEVAAQRPRGDAGEDEVVHRAEQAERHVPAVVVADDQPRRLRVVREALGQPRVERRAERLEVLRLDAEDVGEPTQAASASPEASAAFACSATAANAAGSATARSASDFRSSSMPARWRPFMNWL